MKINFRPWTPPAVTLDKMPEGDPRVASHPSRLYREVVVRTGDIACWVDIDGEPGGDTGSSPSRWTVLDATPTPTHSGDLPPGVWFETSESRGVWMKTERLGYFVCTNGQWWNRTAEVPITRILGTMEVEDANR